MSLEEPFFQVLLNPFTYCGIFHYLLRLLTFNFMMFAFVGKSVQMQIGNVIFSNEKVLNSTVFCAMPSSGAP